MRKVITILIAILFSVGLMACGNKSESEPSKAKTIDEMFEIVKENMDTTQMNESDKEMLNILMQIEDKDITEMKYMAPSTNLNTNQILIIKGNDVDKKIDEYLKNQIELYASYLPEEAEKLKNNEKFTVNDYTIFLVGNSKDEVKKTRELIEK